MRLPAAAGLPPPTAGEAHEPAATAPSADGALPPRAVGEPLEATPAEPAAAMLWGDGVGDAPLPAAPSVGRGRAALGPGQVAEGAQVDVIAASPAWPWPQALHSHAAPLLFVVNALLEDGLYPDFTRPRDPGLPVPMWALLAALAAAWRLPPDPLLALLAERGVGALPLDMPAAPGVAAAPWPQWLAAYARGLRRRLSRRLGRRPSALAGALVLARPAQLWLSEAEWVAEFDLAGHDVAWRLAGLDRDPGWLPASGCSLRFVFDS